MQRLNVLERDFTDDRVLAAALASAVAQNLRDAIDARGHALIALSGGKTPQRFLQILGAQSLDWARVCITLADDRWVPPDDPRSNEGLLRTSLFQASARVAQFVSLYVDTPTPEQGLQAVRRKVDALPLPFDVVVLGMGLNGHCASLFPDGDNLAAALDAQGSARILPMRAPDAGEPRITFTLAALVQARAMYVQIEGDAKHTLLAHILNGDSGFGDAPIRHVLQHACVMPQIFWSA